MQWVKDLASKYFWRNETLCGGLIFEESPFLEWKNGQRTGVNFYRPGNNPKCGVYQGLFELPELVKAQKEAENLRRAILDESIPVMAECLSNNRPIYQAGRYGDLVLLGSIKFERALPQIAECARHSLEEVMRQTAFETMQTMPASARKYSKIVKEALQREKSVWVRTEAAETLGIIGTQSDAQVAREALEEARMLTRAYFQLGYFDQKDKEKRDVCHRNATLFEKLLITLYQLDKKQGKEEFEKSWLYGCPLVSHHTKNAAFWTRIDQLIISPYKKDEDLRIIQVPFTAKKEERCEIF